MVEWLGVTLVSMGPGAIALNLIPYFPHSAASDLYHKAVVSEIPGNQSSKSGTNFVMFSTPAFAAALGTT